MSRNAVASVSLIRIGVRVRVRGGVRVRPECPSECLFDPNPVMAPVWRNFMTQENLTLIRLTVTVNSYG